MTLESLSPIANHLWQSTVFACAAGLLTLTLRKNPARVRHRIWVVASLKFLVPFSLLIALGEHVPWHTASVAAPVSFPVVLDQVSQPFAAPSNPFHAPGVASKSGVLPAILWSVWAFGFLCVVFSSWRRWRRVVAAVRAGSPVDVGVPIPAVSSPSFLEPGVFGLFRPVLLLPAGILNQLTPEQWESVVAHELSHVRHRDNLIGAVQMFIEAVFWFHPLVWWIGKQICQERERGCDEEVLRMGSEPRVYARGILKVCELYLESPVACVAGVSGSNLRKRIESILHHRAIRNLSCSGKVLIGCAAAVALAIPVIVGMTLMAQTRAQTVSPELRFEVASVKSAEPTPGLPGNRMTGIPGPKNNDPGRFSARTRLLMLVNTAYDVPLYRLSDPDDHLMPLVEVEAKMPTNTTREQFNVMLQNLLADRLGLKVHWATQQIDMYTLVVAKGGPKLKVAAPDSPQTSADAPIPGTPDRVGANGFPIPPAGNAPWRGATPGGKIGLRGHNETVAEFASAIAPQTLGAPLTDATGLTGRYDYTIFWSMTATSAAWRGDSAIDDADAPSIFDAVQDQLGLKIEKTKGPVQVLVIDHVEKKPTEN